MPCGAVMALTRREPSGAGERGVGYVEQGFDNIEDETIWEFMLRSRLDILSSGKR